MPRLSFCGLVSWSRFLGEQVGKSAVMKRFCLKHSYRDGNCFNDG